MDGLTAVWSALNVGEMQSLTVEETVLASFAGAVTFVLTVSRARKNRKKHIAEEEQRKAWERQLLADWAATKKNDLDTQLNEFSGASVSEETQIEDGESVSMISSQIDALEQLEKTIEVLNAQNEDLEREKTEFAQKVESNLAKIEAQEKQLAQLASTERQLAESLNTNLIMQADLQRAKRLATDLEKELLERQNDVQISMDFQSMHANYETQLSEIKEKHGTTLKELAELQEKYKVLVDQFFEKEEELSQLKCNSSTHKKSGPPEKPKGQAGAPLQPQQKPSGRSPEDTLLVKALQVKIIQLTKELAQLRSSLEESAKKAEKAQGESRMSSIEATAVAGLVAGILMW